MERYLQSWNEEAVNSYCNLAEKYDLTPTELALSWYVGPSLWLLLLLLFCGSLRFSLPKGYILPHVSKYCDAHRIYSFFRCYHNELCASTIIGATTMDQLEENLKAYDIKLDDVDERIGQEIEAIYKKYTDPTKARNNNPQ